MCGGVPTRPLVLAFQSVSVSMSVKCYGKSDDREEEPSLMSERNRWDLWPALSEFVRPAELCRSAVIPITT